MLTNRFFYNILLWLLLPYIIFRLIWRARKQPEYLRNLGERFGFYSTQSSKPVIWLHAVSLGETRAVQALVLRLFDTYPGYRILLTHSTPTGRAASKQLFGSKVIRAYLPYDYPTSVNRFLSHFKPHLGILMETEIWFNLIHACRAKRTPLLLLNARMSEKSAQRYARFSGLTQEALRSISVVAAQSAKDAERFANLGARSISITGNLKFDITPPAAMLELGRQLRNLFGKERKVVLAASTRNGEEAMILDAFSKTAIPDLLLLIVPRHPQRFDEVATFLEQRGIKYSRKSDLAGIVSHTNSKTNHISKEISVILGDSMGEMFGYYASADIAFIGGSLLPYGGQNLIESCAVGTPVLFGPHIYNFTGVAQKAVEAGVAIQIKDAEQLFHQIQFLFSAPSAISEMKGRCKGFIESNCGATDKSLQIIAKLINSSS